MKFVISITMREWGIIHQKNVRATETVGLHLLLRKIIFLNTE